MNRDGVADVCMSAISVGNCSKQLSCHAALRQLEMRIYLSPKEDVMTYAVAGAEEQCLAHVLSYVTEDVIDDEVISRGGGATVEVVSRYMFAAAVAVVAIGFLIGVLYVGWRKIYGR